MLITFLPELARGGGPSAGWWRGEKARDSPSVTDCVGATSPSKLGEELPHQPFAIAAIAS
jgi:hypothetical protein